MKTARGFTVIEALLALAIFGVIAVLAYRATASLSDGEARLSAEAQRWRALEMLFTRVEADFRQALPRSVSARHASRRGSAHSTTRVGSREQAPEFAVEPGPGGQRIGYRLRAGTLRVTSPGARSRRCRQAGRLYRWSPIIMGFQLEYLTRSGAWRDRWPLLGEDDLPRAVRVTSTLDDDTHIDRWFALR